ncbi:MAG: glycosyltransferase, partial [Candidatus Andersenbacteria bacterium]|nr:glycosyltransferase [Candidatus Andersenbacteria bacterium]
VRTRDWSFFRTRFATGWFAVVAVVVWGVLVGVLRGNGLMNVFLDVNGYLFLGLAPAFFMVLRTESNRTTALHVVVGAFLASVIKTLSILFVFSHKLIGITPEAYAWVRTTGVGEISDLGGYFRVFFQSHIYGLFLFFVVGALLAYQYLSTAQTQRWRAWLGWGTGTFVASALIILVSLSRSIWVGFLLTMVVWAALFLWKERVGIKRVFWLSVATIGAFVLSLGLFVFVVRVPLPGGSGGGESLGLISERTTDLGGEAAAASRWRLLPELFDATLQNAVLGAGFGETVTYLTEDPRYIDTHGHNRITTFSFEWGYLDFWLKMGVPALVYLFFLGWMVREGFRHMREATGLERGLHLGLTLSLLALILTHATTPYLNHPLGIGWLLFVGVYWASLDAERQKRFRTHQALPDLPTQPTVAVHAVTYNSAKIIGPALDSLTTQTYPITVRVIDNNSTDGSADFVRERFPDAEVIESSENGGFTGGHNRLFEQALEDVILLLNPDTILEPDYIERIVEVLKARPDVGVAQGKLLRMKEGEKTPILDSTGLVSLPSLRVVERKGGEEDTEEEKDPIEVFGVSGALAVYRRDALERLVQTHGEYMDESFFMYKDDVDMAYRLRHLGLKALYIPSAVAYHDRWERGSSEKTSVSKLIEQREAKPEWMRIRSTTNQWNLLVKNVFARTFISRLPYVVGVEFGKAMYMLIRSPKVLFVSKLAFLKGIRVTWHKRQQILATSRLYAHEQDQWNAK